MCNAQYGCCPQFLYYYIIIIIIIIISVCHNFYLSYLVAAMLIILLFKLRDWLKISALHPPPPSTPRSKILNVIKCPGFFFVCF